MRELSEKERGELEFWIDHIVGLGCVRESSRSYIEQWSDGAIGRLSHYRSDIAGLQSVENGTWVDVGCGPYPVLLHAPASVNSVMIDPLMKHYFHHNLVPAREERHNQLFLEGFIEDLPLVDQSADVVMCLNALDHVEDPWLGLRELVRILKVGGYLILEVDVGGQTDFMHPHSFEAEELERRAAELGLTSMKKFKVLGGKRRTEAQLYYGFYQRTALVENLFPQAPAPRKGSLKPMLVKEGVRGFNVVQLPDPTDGDTFYAIRQEDGAFEYRRIVSNDYKVFFEGRSLEEVVQKVNASFL